DYLDSECTENKRHRHLSTKEENIHEAIETVANWLVTYHLSKGKSMALKRKQVILEKHDFHEYAKSLHILPRADKTKKGNLGEVILTEYLSQVSSIKVLIYKLHFNPNVDQSMKGDDVLLVDEKKILLGESKFRSTPSKEAVEDVSNLMGNALALPLSLGFIADALFEQDQTELAEQILDIQYKLSRANFNIKNVGFLLSTKLVEKHVEKNMDSINKEFIIISLGMDNPTEFMELAFERAEKLLLEVPEV
ncbi:MAG TPA: Hachiman antiphage defense system protein HamA, partial [Patescibacteria group bacterium]|nr:Hachiman antiphage defense system protein HamA [Patescibacteria group bacterium]